MSRVIFGGAVRRLGLASPFPPTSLRGFAFGNLLIIDSYHRSYLHVFMFQCARSRLRSGGRNELRTDEGAYTYPIYVPFLSSVFLIAAKVIEKSSRSIGKRTARGKLVERLIPSVLVGIKRI
ncbi:hypothetical protein ALC57_02105 [Trachymyrmex cornetzi]|uniref:Uncharacterized protein n=1 Tax=Trachymyrmex cornetzi TaxID=471704 RepID=A0A195EJE2_9HYME|nr:hypothetical protein ALC57_02105 [Trachymyrmex cornetzi]